MDRALLSLAVVVLLLAGCGDEADADAFGRSGQHGTGAGGTEGDEPHCFLAWPNGVEQEWCVPEDWPHRGVCWRTGEPSCGYDGAHYQCYTLWSLGPNPQPVHDYGSREGACMVDLYDCRATFMDNPSCCDEVETDQLYFDCH